MLRLPPELLQEIASYIQYLTIFRRVCKTFEAASIDLFANRYFRNITCFILQPERLLRMNDIANCERLARRVRSVTLTTDPLEDRDPDDIHVVYQPSEDDHWFEEKWDIPLLTTAQCHVAQDYNAECYELYLPYWSTTHKKLLLLSLNLLRTTSSKGISISFTANQPHGRKAELEWVPAQTRIMQEVVMMVATQGFPISEFGSSSRVFALPAMQHRAVDHEMLWDSSRGLKSIHANFCSDLNIFEPDYTGSHFWIQETMLRAAQNLEFLNIYCVPVYDRGILRRSPKLLAEIEFTRLRDVNLQQLEDIHSSTLIEFLKRCQMTLVKLRMWMIDLLGAEQHPWTMPLVLVTQFPKLRTVKLLDLYEKNSQITLASHGHCLEEGPHPFCVLEYDVESGEEHREHLVPIIEQLAGQSYQDLIASISYQELLSST